jgi:DNA (cytosine-5)-methyltransferase 1
MGAVHGAPADADRAGGPSDLSRQGVSATGAHPSRKFKVLSLFAGIGGFDLGLERTGGFETVAFCEIEPEAQAVLHKHWPGVPIYDDVRELTADRLRQDGLKPDCIVGGFPCQDISLAGG